MKASSAYKRIDTSKYVQIVVTNSQLEQTIYTVSVTCKIMISFPKQCLLQLVFYSSKYSRLGGARFQCTGLNVKVRVLN